MPVAGKTLPQDQRGGCEKFEKGDENTDWQQPTVRRDRQRERERN